MNDFLISLKEVSSYLLPLLGVVALALLIVILSELIKVVKKLNEVVNKAVGTVDLTNKSLEKVQYPLETAVKISATIDKAHDASTKALVDAKDYMVSNASVFKEKAKEAKDAVNEIIRKKEKTTVHKEPGPEDIIGG